jgi:excisionase family DNA binding protein
MVLSVMQAAEMLGCKRSRVFQLLADGTLERAPRYGREIRIYEESVKRALQPKPVARRKQRAPSPAGFELSDLRPWGK